MIQTLVACVGLNGEHSALRWMATALVGLVFLVTAGPVGCGGKDGEPDEPEVECFTNAECPDGQVCVAGLQECRECLINEDCPGGQVCVALVCTDGDDPNNDDPDADAGDPEDEQVETPDGDADGESDPVDPPDVDADADDMGVEDEMVEPDVPAPTDCNPPCPGLQRCDLENNACLEPPICLTDVDCLGDKVCFENRCLDRTGTEAAGGCFDDASCAGQGEDLFCNLEGHNCLPGGRCNRDAQCPGDLVCGLGGLCRQCAGDEDCPGNLQCDTADAAFVCVEPPECVTNDDCRGDRTCVIGRCTEPMCQDDNFEPNNVCSQATAVTDGNYAARKICRDDCDWYSMEVGTGDGLVARVRHDPSLGDLDLTLHGGPCENDNPGPLLQRSASLAPNEVVSFPRVFNPTTFYFSVCPFVTPQDGGTNEYELDVLTVEGGFCVDDVYDENSPNDEPPRASQLTVLERPFEFRAGNLQVCPDSGDWYRLQVNQDDFVTVTIEFNDSFGDLDLLLFDGQPINEQAPPLVASQTRNNVESVSAAISQGGEIYIFVGSPIGGQNEYTMTVEVVAECTDSFEPNDTVNDAADLSGLPPTTFNGLRWCAPTPIEENGQVIGETEPDADWFTATLNPGQAVVATVRYDENLGQDISAELLSRPGDPAPAVVTGTAGVLSFAIVPSTVDSQVFFGLSSQGESSLTYSLTYEVRSADEICVDDDLDNRTFEGALSAEFGVREYRGVVCPDGDEPGADYYRVNVPAGTWMFANIQNEAEGLEVRILDAEQNLLSLGQQETFGQTAFVQIDEESTVTVAVQGVDADAQGSYLLQMTSQPAPAGPECTEDFLEDPNNDTYEEGRAITTNTWFRNLLLCPTDADWYTFPVIAGDNISITIQTHQPVEGAVRARVYDIFGPPFAFVQTVSSDAGVLQINVNGLEVFDGGQWAIEIFNDELETVWYDLRIITN